MFAAVNYFRRQSSIGGAFAVYICMSAALASRAIPLQKALAVAKQDWNYAHGFLVAANAADYLDAADLSAEEVMVSRIDEASLETLTAIEQYMARSSARRTTEDFNFKGIVEKELTDLRIFLQENGFPIAPRESSDFGESRAAPA